MQRYLIIEVTTGEIVRTSICAVPPEPPDGFAVMLHDVAKPSTHYLAGSELRAYSKDQELDRASRPSSWATWSNSLMAWVDQRPEADRLAGTDAEARASRAVLLGQSDWTQLPDAVGRLGVDRVQAWVAYRQALCDITRQPGYPAAITWPTAPGA